MSSTRTVRSPDVTTGVPTSCTYCGTAFEYGEWYPVATESSGRDGKPVINSFCDDDCLAAWKAAR